MRNLLWVMLFSFFSFATPNNQESELDCEIENYKNLLADKDKQIENLHTYYKDPLRNLELSFEKPEELFDACDDSNYYLGTNISFLEQCVPNISQEMYSAILELPKQFHIIVTSAFRFGPHSLHHHKRALDLRYNQETDDFLNWMVTEEGKAWRVKHNIRFFIEDNRLSKFLQKFRKHDELKQFVFFNRKATGKHIHVEINA